MRRTILLLLFLLVLVLVVADEENLDVATCTGTCSVTGLNSDDTAADGATIGKGNTLSTTWSDTAFASASTITKVDLILVHSGAIGISGDLTITLRNGTGTVYCSFTRANSVASSRYTVDTTGSCSWTKGRLDDLTITVHNGDGGGPSNAYLSFIDLNITYTPPDTTEPIIQLISPDNRSWDLDGNVTLVYAPWDDRDMGDCRLFFDGTYNQTNATQVVNNTNNNFTLTEIPDGNHTWWVNCSDTSGNTNVSVTRQVRIDTTGPQVNLETPLEGNVSSTPDIIFHFNATDAQTTLASCRLLVNGSLKDTRNDPAETTSLSLSATLANGKYVWQVSCTDSNGLIGLSEERNLTVSTTFPSVTPVESSYYLGEAAMVQGENWNALVELVLNYTLPGGAVAVHRVNTTAAGTFSDSLQLNYSMPNGTYLVKAWQESDPTENSSTSFSVLLLPTTITAGATSYRQGDEARVTGRNFTPSGLANVTFTFSDDSTDDFVVATNTTGGFIAYRNLSYSAPLGLVTVTAFDASYPKFNGTTDFSVTLRTALLTTDSATYGRNANVDLYGRNFSRQGLVEIAIYDDANDAVGTGFPLNKSTDDTGYFTHPWNTNSWCNGIYRVEGYDQTYGFLNDTTTFTIQELIMNEEIIFASAGSKEMSPATHSAITPGNVNESDNQDESLSANTGTLWYFEFNFTNAYNRALHVEKVLFLIEHAETIDLTTPTVQVWNGSDYLTACSGYTPSATDHVDTCDLSSYLPSPESLDLVSVRFTLNKGSGPETATVDYVHLNVTTDYEPSCTYFNGSTGGGLAENPPFVSSVLLEDSVVSPPDELDLNAGTTRMIACNATVLDGDGYATLQSVNATLYSATVARTASDDPRNHYTNASCDLVAGSGSEANYTCGFRVAYYAINGTWSCTVEASDGSDFSNRTDSSFMNALFALNITPTLIDYGDIAEGETSSERFANITNIGNMPINVSVKGYGVVEGDGLSFNCTQENLSVAATRFSLSSGDYSAKTSLSSSFIASGLSIVNTLDGAPSYDFTFWQVQVPTSGEPRGECNGTIVFQGDA